MMPKNLRDLRERSKHLNTTVLNARTVIVSSDSNPVANHIVTIQYGDDGVINARCTCPWRGLLACNGSAGTAGGVQGAQVELLEQPRRSRTPEEAYLPHQRAQERRCVDHQPHGVINDAAG
jgi:hypothetical protein